MDKGEGLEQKSNDWERVERKHIDWGHIRKCWGRLWESKKKKEKKKKEKKRLERIRSWNCLHLKTSQR